MKKSFRYKTKDGREYKISSNVINNQWNQEKAGVYDEYSFKVANDKEFSIKFYFSEVLETQWAVDLTVEQIRGKKEEMSIKKVKDLLNQGQEEDYIEYYDQV